MAKPLILFLLTLAMAILSAAFWIVAFQLYYASVAADYPAEAGRDGGGQGAGGLIGIAAVLLYMAVSWGWLRLMRKVGGR